VSTQVTSQGIGGAALAVCPLGASTSSKEPRTARTNASRRSFLYESPLLDAVDGRGRLVRLLKPVSIGLFLVAIPTAFSVFPQWGEWPPGIRVVVLLSWLVAATFAVWITAKGDSQRDEALNKDYEAAKRNERRTALTGQFDSLLGPRKSGFDEHYNFTVYVPVCHYLVPIYPRIVHTSDPSIFPIGEGATGKAWDRRAEDREFKVLGSAVSNDEHGLTKEQQRRFANFQTVAATVIRDERNHPVGVLTVIGRAADGVFRDGGDGMVGLRRLADNIAHLVPAARDWMLPHPDEEDSFRDLVTASELPASLETRDSDLADDHSAGYQSVLETERERHERALARKEQRDRARDVGKALRAYAALRSERDS